MCVSGVIAASTSLHPTQAFNTGGIVEVAHPVIILTAAVSTDPPDKGHVFNRTAFNSDANCKLARHPVTYTVTSYTFRGADPPLRLRA